MDSSIIQSQLNTLEKDTYSVHVHILILNFFETVLGEKKSISFRSSPFYFLRKHQLFGMSEIDLKLGAEKLQRKGRKDE